MIEITHRVDHRRQELQGVAERIRAERAHRPSMADPPVESLAGPSAAAISAAVASPRTPAAGPAAPTPCGDRPVDAGATRTRAA